MSEFYMTLPSNACLDIFPNNTLSSYLVKLERPLRLDGKWLVGMVEMHYPNSWDNVTDGKIIITQGINSAKVMFISTGRYRSIDEVLLAIRDALLSFNMNGSIRFSQNKVQNTCCIEVKERDLKIQVSKNLANILGLDDVYYGFGKSTGSRMCDISEGFSSLYVYSNIVEPQIVGDVQAQLLRIVAVKEKSRIFNHVESFQHVQYLPVSDNGTETIKMFIRKDDGRPVLFQTGKVIVTLHFKKSS